MKKILLLTLTLSFGLASFAQRTIDLSVEEFLAPTAITSNTQTGTPVSIQAVIKNNSTTDTVMVGDTLIFQAAIRNLQNQAFTATSLLFRLATQEILPGDTQHFRLGFTWGSYLLKSARVNLSLIVWLTNRPELALDNGANNTLVQEMDYINPNGFGVSVEGATATATEAKAYPNPTNGNVSFTIPYAEVQKNITMSITNLMGKEIFSKTVSSVDDLSADLSGLNNGIYLVQIKSGETTFNTKVTVAK